MDNYAAPRDDIQVLVARCDDPQMSTGTRESAKRVQRWLDGEDPDAGTDAADETDDEDSDDTDDESEE